MHLICFMVSYADTIPSIKLRDSLQIYNIGNQIALLEDPSNILSVEEVANRPSSFVLSKQPIPLYGPTTAAIWCTFEVNNLSMHNWYLEIGTPFMPQIDFYRQMPDGRFSHDRFGTKEPYLKRPVHTNQFIIPLQVAAGGRQRFYLRFSSNHTLTFPLRIATLQSIYESNQKQ